ncbi:NADH-cytochrome b5 reductase-like [Rhopalosiphum padi]|uniref:NADH-cytochrome b5 reductase-like n=1 Tax=Rhopalosiphum padi TaxID=40932 RepID=UPI00298E6AD7|nr:NADH-cytochrome b5 reductase-like [Rhopalosiphum padi]
MYDPPPERPSESDCCGNGCAECVFDVYDRECAGWRHRLRTGGEGDRLRRDLLSATKHKPYRIVSTVALANDVRAYTFAATPTAVGRLPIAYTQHVHIRLADGLSRPYTPVALGDDDCSFDVLVKAYPGGRFTGRLSEMTVDDVVTVRGPFGGVRYDGYDSIVMFGGGTGVAAFAGLIGSVLDDDKCETLLRLHYSCKTLDGVLMRKELAGHAAYWNCAVHLYLTREQDWSQCSKSFWYNENITEGRISKDCIAKIIDKQHNLRTLWLICGNDEFNQYVLNSLVNYNIKQDNIQLLNNTTKDFEVS